MSTIQVPFLLFLTALKIDRPRRGITPRIPGGKGF